MLKDITAGTFSSVPIIRSAKARNGLLFNKGMKVTARESFCMVKKSLCPLWQTAGISIFRYVK